MATVRSYTARVRPGMKLPATIGEQITLGATTLFFKGGVGVGFVMERVVGRGMVVTPKVTFSPDDANRGRNSEDLNKIIEFLPQDQVVESAEARVTDGPPSVTTLTALGQPVDLAVRNAELEAQAAALNLMPYGPEPRAAFPAELRSRPIQEAVKAAMAGLLSEAVTILQEEIERRRLVESEPAPVMELPTVGPVAEKDDPSLPLGERVRIALDPNAPEPVSMASIKIILDEIKAPGKRNERASMVSGILATIAGNQAIADKVWTLIQAKQE